MSPVSHTVDVIVLGAGPAGVHAALAAVNAGLAVALFDENPAAGGQVYRAPAFAPDASMTASADAARGEALRHALAQSPVQCFFGHKVWNVAEDYRIDALGPQGSLTCHARALIVAVGTSERVVPFEGWTTPGVIGLAAATILLKSQQALPGKTTLIAGCGPLLAAVAAGTRKAGGELVAVADVASRADWLRALPALLARPDLLRQGVSWTLALRRAGVTMLHRNTLVKVSPNAGENGLCAELAPCDAAGRPHKDAVLRRFDADCVVVGHGLVPATEITRLLHAQHHYDRTRGGWVASADAHGQTSRARLFVAGDAAGIAGAAAAAHHGTLAGLACARAFGLVVADARLAVTQRAHTRAARGGQAMGRLMALRAGHVDGIAPETIVCRCEDVTRAEIEAACRDGACDVNQLKAWTRCGMGPCQGRSCGDVAAELLARQLALPRAAVGVFSARTPLRPIRLGDLSGAFDYADIPTPKAAPL